MAHLALHDAGLKISKLFQVRGEYSDRDAPLYHKYIPPNYSMAYNAVTHNMIGDA